MGRRSKGTAESLASPATVRLRALLSLGMVVGLGAVGTLAAWSDQAIATAQFSAGTLDLTLNGDASDAIAPTSLTMSNMHPGSSESGVLTVANAGTLPFTYNVSATAADNAGNTASLGSALRIAVYPGGLASDGINCASTTAMVSDATFNGAPLLSTTRSPLTAGTSEQLCIRVSLPTTADNSLQSMGTTATFTFTGNQVT